MSDVDDSLTARITAIEQVLAYLLAEHVTRTPIDCRQRQRASFFNRTFVPATGLEDVAWLDALRLETESHLNRLFDIAEVHARNAETAQQ